MTTSRRSQAKAAISNASDRLANEIKRKNRDRREAAGQLSAAQGAGDSCRNDLLPALELVWVPIDELRLSPRRLRKCEPAHKRAVANSIATYGLVDPVQIGRKNTVINGEVIIEAARLLGLTQVPCIRVDHLSDTEQRLLRLALNRLAEKNEWNIEALKVELGELILSDEPIEITGFGKDEVDQILAADHEDGFEAGPHAPEPGAAPVARTGDEFELGPHSVICGDATVADVMRRLMSRSQKSSSSSKKPTTSLRRPQARIVLTDQPYNVRIGGNVTGGSHREFVMASGEMTPAEYLVFTETWMSAALPHLANGGVLATFIDWRGYATIDAAALNLGLDPLNLVVWAKSNAGMGSLYRSQHELLPLYKKGDVPHVNNVKLGKRGRWRSNVWNYPGASSLGSDARRGLADHPTVKPTAMLEDALLDLTDRGDIVVDPFLGSGSTLVAAHHTGRICRGIEIDPLYVGVIVRRFEAATGVKAVLAETGETFDEVAARRAPQPVPKVDTAGVGARRRQRRRSIPHDA